MSGSGISAATLSTMGNTAVTGSFGHLTGIGRVATVPHFLYHP